MGRRLAGLATGRLPVRPATAARCTGAGAHWVRPEVVVEVAYGEWTADGRLRHPVYLGERTDVDASTVVRPGTVPPPG